LVWLCINELQSLGLVSATSPFLSLLSLLSSPPLCLLTPSGRLSWPMVSCPKERPSASSSSCCLTTGFQAMRYNACTKPSALKLWLLWKSSRARDTRTRTASLYPGPPSPRSVAFSLQTRRCVFCLVILASSSNQNSHSRSRFALRPGWCWHLEQAGHQ